MKTKKLLISLIMVVFGITLVSSSAMAGSKQRHRWEGVAIGVGAAILGNAIYQAHRAEQRPQVVYVEPEPTCRYRRHYNRKGHWVPGHWIEVKTEDGHWTQERVWVARNHSPY
ncbi:MAG: hypothetical protein HGJ94_17805 [Desulfosarcina sp.]|nr:hypothetical protein [Desulfosarcina sp.]